jgi:hypothetical protein
MVIHSNNDHPFISVKTHDIFKDHKRYVIIFYIYKKKKHSIFKLYFKNFRSGFLIKKFLKNFLMNFFNYFGFYFY